MVALHGWSGYRIGVRAQARAYICGTVASPEVWATLNKMSFYTLEPVGFIRSTMKWREGERTGQSTNLDRIEKSNADFIRFKQLRQSRYVD